ncbi:MAG: hypothetical protein ACRDPK_17690 [Carbonactinosporaceae bacterium]
MALFATAGSPVSTWARTTRGVMWALLGMTAALGTPGFTPIPAQVDDGSAAGFRLPAVAVGGTLTGAVLALYAAERARRSSLKVARESAERDARRTTAEVAMGLAAVASAISAGDQEVGEQLLNDDAARLEALRRRQTCEAFVIQEVVTAEGLFDQRWRLAALPSPPLPRPPDLPHLAECRTLASSMPSELSRQLGAVDTLVARYRELWRTGRVDHEVREMALWELAGQLRDTLDRAAGLLAEDLIRLHDSILAVAKQRRALRERAVLERREITLQTLRDQLFLLLDEASGTQAAAPPGSDVAVHKARRRGRRHVKHSRKLRYTKQ